MGIDEEEAPALVSVSVEKEKEEDTGSPTTAKVPLTIVTGTCTPGNPGCCWLTQCLRLPWCWEDYIGKLYIKRAAWQADSSHS